MWRGPAGSRGPIGATGGVAGPPRVDVNGPPGVEKSKGLSEVKRIRTEFPETWLWSNVISGYLLI